MNKFINFLKSDEKIFVEEKSDKEKIFCVKMPHFIKGWEILYFADSCSYYEKNLELSGYYNTIEQKIFNPSYSLKWKIGEKEIEQISYNYSKVEEEMKEKVLQNLAEKYKKGEYTIPSEEETKRRNSSLNYQSEEIAKNMFLTQTEEFVSEYSLKLDKEDLMKFLINEKQEINNFTTSYFSDEEKVSYYIYMKNLQDKIFEALKNLKQQGKENGMEKIKNIRNCIPQDCKTVNVTISKNNQEGNEKINFTCKVPTNRISYFQSMRDWISNWDITPVKDREEFKKLFGRSADIRVEDIIKITHGKKVLYSEEEE